MPILVRTFIGYSTRSMIEPKYLYCCIQILNIYNTSVHRRRTMVGGDGYSSPYIFWIYVIYSKDYTIISYIAPLPPPKKFINAHDFAIVTLIIINLYSCWTWFYIFVFIILIKALKCVIVRYVLSLWTFVFRTWTTFCAP